MTDPDANSEPPSGIALAVALGRGEAAGLLAALDAYGPDLVDYAQFMLAGTPAGPTSPAALLDEAAGAVLDALLVATVAVTDLTDPARMPAWLLALTRNECLRRRPGTGVPAGVEAAELGRRGLGPDDVAALLGLAPGALPAPQPATETVPGWLRAELVDSAGPEGAAHRAELARRARPFEPDGFPVPLDRRRLSRSTLAWSTAAAVVAALLLLVAAPARGGGSAVTAVPGGPLLAAAPQAPAENPEEPLPTLPETVFVSPQVPPRAEPAADRGGSRPQPAVEPTPVPTAGADAGSTGGTGADRRSRPFDTLALSWSADPDPTCEEWTAQLYATVEGGTAVSQVMATAGNGETVVLQRAGDGWSGQLAGLPTDRSVMVTVSADGPVKPASSKLSASC